jgi:phosphatidylserine/phosphatidylglycerophosphate/cardiolipin synthase-like enzyme
MRTRSRYDFRKALAHSRPFATTADDSAPVIHYAPIENLEHIDVALIDAAKREIDLAAYVLTDWPVIQALTRAADRGVKTGVAARLGRALDNFSETFRGFVGLVKDAKSSKTWRGNGGYPGNVSSKRAPDVMAASIILGKR